MAKVELSYRECEVLRLSLRTNIAELKQSIFLRAERSQFFADGERLRLDHAELADAEALLEKLYGVDRA